jgi:hypothetical protein
MRAPRTLGVAAFPLIVAATSLGSLVSCAVDGRVNVPIDLGIANNTALTLTLVVNGQTIGSYQPGESETHLVPPALPDPPWHAEARTSTGRVLLSLDVKPGDVWRSTPDVNGRSAGQSRATFLNLSCGRLDLFAVTAVGGPAPPPSFPPGDCLP